MSASTMMAAQAATGAGAWVPVRQIRDLRTFQVTITGVATVALEGSNDGVNAVPLQANIKASAGYEDAAPWNYMRANVTSYASGTITVVMGERV